MNDGTIDLFGLQAGAGKQRLHAAEESCEQVIGSGERFLHKDFVATKQHHVGKGAADVDGKGIAGFAVAHWPSFFVLGMQFNVIPQSGSSTQASGMTCRGNTSSPLIRSNVAPGHHANRRSCDARIAARKAEAKRN